MPLYGARQYQYQIKSHVGDNRIITCVLLTFVCTLFIGVRVKSFIISSISVKASSNAVNLSCSSLGNASSDSIFTIRTKC